MINEYTMNTSDNVKINNIEMIYQQYSIYKSLFVCYNQNVEKYYNALKERDFSISKISDIHKFKNHESRILLIDDNDLNHFDLIKISCKLNISDISIIIYIDDIKPIKELVFIPKIIL